MAPAITLLAGAGRADGRKAMETRTVAKTTMSRGTQSTKTSRPTARCVDDSCARFSASQLASVGVLLAW